MLGVFNAWSPDDSCVVFSSGRNHLNRLIQKVNIATGDIKTLYRIENYTSYGPVCGTPSYCPSEDKIIFIHGPLNCTSTKHYEFWRRSAVAIIEPDYGQPIFIDARDVTFPFTRGALRGGTHCHEWSYNGQWLAFTYNDMLMAKIEDETGKICNLRTIGVSNNIESVVVDKDPTGENFDGNWFSVLLVKVVSNPKPDSDEISRAYENCWVGLNGYRDSNDKWQRAIAFKGDTVSRPNDIVTEIYLVDVPDDITCGTSDPLEGTKNSMPSPPLHANVRRLTYTSGSKYPRLTKKPRFWLRSSHDGDRIFFLARDKNGISQVYFVRLSDYKLVKVTDHKSDVVSTVSVASDDQKICYICDNSVFVTVLENLKSFRLTDKHSFKPSNPIWSNSGSKIVFNRKDIRGFLQIYTLEY